MKFRGLEDYYSVDQILNVKTRQIVSFDDMVNDLSNNRLVFIGETHENRYHHEVQLRVLKALYEKNPRIAIGMEMFQRPFQEILDEYIEGKIDEKTYLKRSEYFKRWRYDYNFYKGIIELAREKGIRIIALNIKREIIDKISEKGIEELTEEERKEVSEIVTYDDAHKRYLREVFEKHEIPEERFEFFYQAQLAWDQTMARSISEFFKREEGYSMVVMAGAGHSLRFGIPDRVKRLSEIDSKILIPEDLEEATWDPIDQGLADYIWFTKGAEEEDIKPRLMVSLIKKDGMVTVEKVHTGPAEKAGVKKGDVILSMDGVKIEDTDDVTIFMLNKRFGETVRLRVKRDKEELDIDVHLIPSNPQ